MPYVSRPRIALRAPITSVAPRIPSSTISPGNPCSPRLRAYVLWAEMWAIDSNCPGPAPSGYSSAGAIPARWPPKRSVS